MHRRKNKQEMDLILYLEEGYAHRRVLEFIKKTEGATLEQIADSFTGSEMCHDPYAPGHKKEINIDLNDPTAVRQARITNLEFYDIMGKLSDYSYLEEKVYRINGQGIKILETAEKTKKAYEKWAKVLEEKIIPHALGELLRIKIEVNPHANGIPEDFVRDLIRKDKEIPNLIAELDDRDLSRILKLINGIDIARHDQITFKREESWWRDKQLPEVSILDI
ncbi:MAG: hypothetical protein GOU97_03945 [Nanoarchaeota archaeon]|nr:hypothetical protein [Nanoarchaeota archaeon]